MPCPGPGRREDLLVGSLGSRLPRPVGVRSAVLFAGQRVPAARPHPLLGDKVADEMHAGAAEHLQPRLVGRRCPGRPDPQSGYLPGPSWATELPFGPGTRT